ncbi:MAG: hypothetical protein COZ90_00715 [Candidatus Nealsonbacteria bacterium CG_4_8_14_3_um_filter_37_36]|uniref:Uncharacterized protein n=4 Tax=Candidatus Nealsoniibacteriota TaxID=1817911 RepID=A0A2M7EBY6_9BACT|nr:MAG: hypothetical protein COS09_00900 [Candidatus Nealsonbacteria bacterium CG01_land_8_20_14_3_00_12]PIW35056.1 MAG: hypothetical protein COW25_01140 [Candidatus Nealsonbacteria bacterium CG15_BIG_FIL_POST_REV_8_21_14_020_37_12]PIW91455.1 MAG: hypothetical protein COZ90_00715 [Candidatus Nealsonbacteria bacterium CG_4_8_14_3_um_filter_37_36]PJA83937.1 MAG: hypothetical protein CO146_00125 [Candidatus Nealsonbacteria bacterium CG_4_9_14_3_um_filter_37_29]
MKVSSGPTFFLKKDYYPPSHPPTRWAPRCPTEVPYRRVAGGSRSPKKKYKVIARSGPYNP